MNIRDAIFKAADHIDRSPDEFRFSQTEVPSGPGCGTPGCAIGWIGHFMGVKDRRTIGLEASNLLATGPDADLVFYQRMDLLGNGIWRANPHEVARLMRLYADKYHPAESRALIPASVRVIFDMTPAQLAREFERA